VEVVQEAQEVAERAQVAQVLEPVVLGLELAPVVPGLAEPVVAAVVRPEPGAAAAILPWM